MFCGISFYFGLGFGYLVILVVWGFGFPSRLCFFGLFWLVCFDLIAWCCDFVDVVILRSGLS